MKQVQSRLNFEHNNLSYPRQYGKQALLFKDMYIALLNNKSISYMTTKSSYIIEKIFKQMFDIDVIALRVSKISVKLILKNDDRKF